VCTYRCSIVLSTPFVVIFGVTFASTNFDSFSGVQSNFLPILDFCFFFPFQTELGSFVTEKGKTAAAVNIFGVVLGFGCPRFTRSGDWMMTVWVVDESIPLPQSAANSEGTNVDPAHDHSIPSVSINIFVKERSQLPNLLVAGDVLRCHRLGVQMWNDEIQCLGRRNSSFVVIRPKANAIPDGIEAAWEASQEDAWSVIPTATRSFTFDQKDLSRATVLWRWGQTRLLQHPTIKVSTKFRLADMKRQWETDSAEEVIEHGDLTVMVAAKIQVPNEMRTGVTPRGYLRVWDGTGELNRTFMCTAHIENMCDATKITDCQPCQSIPFLCYFKLSRATSI